MNEALGHSPLEVLGAKYSNCC